MKPDRILPLFLVALLGIFIYAGGHILAFSSSNQLKGLELFSLIFGLLFFIAIIAFVTIKLYPLYVKENNTLIKKNESIETIKSQLAKLQSDCDAYNKRIEDMAKEIKNLPVSRLEKESVLKYLIMKNDSPVIKEEYRNLLLKTFDMEISSGLDQGKEETSESK
ncbi:MAG: hypothetical protein IPI30_19435 [Saprospiraceae bacterium]|nr:hypothetical protein [Candidatus Vicinibacter affinis]MBK7696398.1 hypothetical protein [Candidatus Vicinibacter affinis]